MDGLVGRALEAIGPEADRVEVALPVDSPLLHIDAGQIDYAPGNDPYVLTVGASDPNGTASTLDDTQPTWSSFGTTVDGYATLERMKATPSLADVPVIVISAVDELDSVVRCIELGALDYLPKPVDPAILRARVGAALSAKRLRDLDVRRQIS